MTAGPTPTAPTTTAPSPLADHLGALLEALDAVHPGSAAKLAPGWPEDAIRQRCVVDTFQPPEPWVRLLAWRDGSPLDTPVFRDHSMLGLEAALACNRRSCSSSTSAAGFVSWWSYLTANRKSWRSTLTMQVVSSITMTVPSSPASRRMVVNTETGSGMSWMHSRAMTRS